jgi:hypothetical protein
LPLPGIAAGDLDGEPMVVLTRSDGEVWGLDRTGIRRWTWRDPSRPGENRPPAPLLLKGKAGGGDGVLLRQSNYAPLVVLDAQGRERQRVSGVTLIAVEQPVTADGALLSFADGKLRLTRGGVDTKDLAWEWSPPGGSTNVLRVLAEGQGGVVVASSNYAAIGLDLATGRPRWRCDGPCLPTGVMPADDPTAPPLVLFAQPDGATACRRALAIEPDGRYRLPAAEPITSPPLPEDPRSRVPLPWVALYPNDLARLDWPSLLLVQFALALSYILLRSAAWVFRRGSWAIGLLICLLLVAGPALGVGLATLRAAAKFTDRYGALMQTIPLVLIGLPALAFLWRAVAWSVQGRWRRVGVLLGGSALLAVPLCVLMLRADRDNLGPTQHYTADGWYLAWVVGAYAAGALLILGWLLRAAFRGVSRLARGAFRLVRPAKARAAA